MEYELIWQTSTHQPVIRAVMDLYRPAFVLELGIGNYSTPIFKEYDIELMSVENDKDWIDYIKHSSGNHNIIHHELPGIERGTGHEVLFQDTIDGIIEFYSNIKVPEVSNLIFVDQYRCARIFSLNTLGPKFDYIIYHDSQPAATWNFRYDLINLPGYNTYTLETPESWTTLKVKNELDKGFDLLNAVIKPHIENFKRANFKHKLNPSIEIKLYENT
jgi:hypothetical protein